MRLAQTLATLDAMLVEVRSMNAEIQIRPPNARTRAGDVPAPKTWRRMMQAFTPKRRSRGGWITATVENLVFAAYLLSLLVGACVFLWLLIAWVQS